MKSHLLAKELIALSKVLKNGPNIEIGNLNFEGPIGSSNHNEMAFGITTLAQLSKFKKSEWISFVSEHQLPIVFNQRDSARNIMGKIMSYLSSHDDALVRVKSSIANNSSGSSQKLNKALSALLDN